MGYKKAKEIILDGLDENTDIIQFEKVNNLVIS